LETDKQFVPRGNGETAPPLQESAEAAPSVLIVDDDPFMVEILSQYLEKRGHFHVTKAYSGMHAMIHLAQNRPDYLLVDLIMPQINGERVIQYCRELWRDAVRIVVITGKDLSQKEIRDFESKGATVILKGDERNQGIIKSLDAVITLPATQKS